MKKNMQGFTLIELMIVVAIIAILAAIALPAYSDYTKKAKVTEVITAASGGRTTVAEYVSSNSGVCPPAGTVADSPSTFVTSVTNAGCVITALGQVPGAPGDIVLTGTVDPANYAVDWVCSGSIDAKFRPGSCQGVKQ
jgi:type IV pilus assembly protein PilA